MIQIITRIRYTDLYRKMQESARKTASGPIMFSASHDDGSPRIAESYNLLGATSMCDILLFVHDDVIFLSNGWDKKIEDAFKLGFNVAGVVGSQKYDGGMIFDAGRQYAAGKLVYLPGSRRMVKLMANRSEIEPVKVVDGLFMAVDSKHFQKNGFDLQFDGLFYYDMDFCLRSNCVVIDTLVSHEKTSDIRGKYPEDMKPREHYAEAFNKKHGFKGEPPIGDQSCQQVPYEDYALEGIKL